MRRGISGAALATILAAMAVSPQQGNYISVHRTKDIPYGKIGAMYFGPENDGDTMPDGIAFRWECPSPAWSMDTLVFKPVCNCPLPIKRIRIYRGEEDLLLLDRFAAEDSVGWDSESNYAFDEEEGKYLFCFCDTALVIDHPDRESSGQEWSFMSALFWYILPQTLHADSGDSMEVVLSYIPEYHSASEADGGERHGYRVVPSTPASTVHGGEGNAYHVVAADGALAATLRERPDSKHACNEAGLAPGVYLYRQCTNGTRPSTSGVVVVR